MPHRGAPADGNAPDQRPPKNMNGKRDKSDVSQEREVDREFELEWERAFVLGQHEEPVVAASKDHIICLN